MCGFRIGLEGLSERKGPILLDLFLKAALLYFQTLKPAYHSLQNQEGNLALSLLLPQHLPAQLHAPFHHPL